MVELYGLKYFLIFLNFNVSDDDQPISLSHTNEACLYMMCIMHMAIVTAMTLSRVLEGNVLPAGLCDRAFALYTWGSHRLKVSRCYADCLV